MAVQEAPLAGSPWPERSRDAEAGARVFRAGRAVGELARRLFPGGELIGHGSDLWLDICPACFPGNPRGFFVTT
jgi:hypothetical protein